MIKESKASRYDRAFELAEKKHRGQLRIGGSAYITHPVAVAEIVRSRGFDEDYQITALFHDLLEDTDATEREIEEIGGAAVLAAVKALTKEKGYVMREYVDGILKNPMAKAVKAADRLHNLKSAFVTDEDFKRRYILETLDWYMELDSEIPKAVRLLAQTLAKPLTEHSLLYEPIEAWKADNK